MTQQESIQGDKEAQTTIVDVRFEHHRNAFGVGEARPRLSWIVATTTVGWHQTSYEIEAYEADQRLREQTGRVKSDQSVLVPWPFAPLSSREQLMMRVRVWGNDGQPSAWSMLSLVEAGLFHTSDWTAHFVTPDWEEDTSRSQPAPLLRRTFDVRTGITRARLYATALGVYEAYINGITVGDSILDPGWTDYNDRLRYQTFDVTNLLHEGRNALAAMLADGWYRGRIGLNGGRRNIYGDRLALLAQLEIEYADGTTERIVTDEAWRATTGPILSADIYDGETYDARLELPGWSQAEYNDGDWVGVRPIEQNFATLVAPSGPPMRRIEQVTPAAITSSPTGKMLVDFGQNLVGRLRLTVCGEAGQTITLRHAEILEYGELCTRPLRTAKATDSYTLRGNGMETWEPRFTFHGFRYVEVEGWPGSLQTDNISAIVCHSDLERIGWFECSDPLINRFHENVVWSMRSNFLSIPTDCPQRDERLGWTGDIQVFAPTACFLYDSADFLSSWLADLVAEQKAAGGIVPFVVPNVIPMAPIPVAAWGDAAVIVPWVLYQEYGDVDVLDAQFESMCLWVDRVAQVAGEKHLWDRGFQFGDWLDPTASPDHPNVGLTDPHVVATAYFARSAELLGRIAGILGRIEHEAHYLALANQIRDAFDAEYVTPSGRVLSDSQTAYALALQFGLLRDAEMRRHAGERLIALVRESGYRINTGFVGTPLLCDALCSVGASHVAYALLMQRDCPSWLYPVTMGATTIWERWDSLRPDGSVNPGAMTSFNHYALGAVADWLHHTVGGLSPITPGYRRFTVRPQPGGGLTHARARLYTPYGLAESSWTIDREHIEVIVVVPANVTASVTLPGSQASSLEVGSGRHRWSYAYHVAKSRSPRLLDSTISELIADPQTWAMVVTTLRQHISGLTRYMDIAKMLLENSSMTLRQFLSLLPHSDELAAALEAAFAALEC